MSGLLSQLIPAAIVGALAPFPIIILITLLTAEGGLGKALGFGLALTGAMAVVGAIALGTASTNAGSSDKGSAITGTVVAMLGGVLLVSAVKQLLHAPDPDAPPPRFLTKLDQMSPGGAAVVGLVVAVVNVKQMGIFLAGVATIVNADVTTGQGWLALVILLVIIQLGVIIPPAGYVLARDWTTRQVKLFRGWLVGHNRVISIILGLVVGAAFLLKGIIEIAG